MTTLSVQTQDGWNLGLEYRKPVGPRRGTVLLLHAMMVDARTLDRPPGSGFASFLVERGFEVYIGDLRGRGRSGPKCSEGGSWSYDDLVRYDVPAMLAAIAERDPGALWVLGHSLGSHVTAACMSSGASSVKPHGYVLIAGNVWLPSLEGSQRMRLRKGLAMRLFRAVGRAVGRWPSRRLRLGSVDEAMPYVEDLTRFWFDDAWQSRDGQDYLSGMESIEGPILAVTGAGDTLFGHVEGARSFAEKFGAGRAEFIYARSGRKGLRWDPDHMGVVTDPRSRPIWEEIADWMAANSPDQ